MFCTKCGEKLELNIKFCTNCGAKVEVIGEPVKNAPKTEVKQMPKGPGLPPVPEKKEPQKSPGLPPVPAANKKDNKKLLMLVVIVIVVIGGVLVLSNNVKDRTLAMMEDIAAKNGIEASIKQEQFTWYTGYEDGDEIPVDGYVFEADAITDAQMDYIDTYFEKAGYATDEFNTADGTIAGMVGYKKGSTVCQFYGEITGGEAAMDNYQEGDEFTFDAGLYCGELE